MTTVTDFIKESFDSLNDKPMATLETKISTVRDDLLSYYNLMGRPAAAEKYLNFKTLAEYCMTIGTEQHG